jgi:uncharacterized DUF497 family protein
MFEWDENKRAKTIKERHLDFRDARLIFDGRPIVNIPAYKNKELRFISIAMIEGKLFSVVWTWRGDWRRIISFRRARDGEEKAYRQIHG